MAFFNLKLLLFFLQTSRRTLTHRLKSKRRLELSVMLLPPPSGTAYQPTPSHVWYHRTYSYESRSNKVFFLSSSDRFGPLVQDVWAGEYSTLKPTNFKSSLEMNHPQFKGSVQHDCQEFLALLLGSLHEELKAKNRGNGHRGKYNKANSSSYGGRNS